MPVPQVEEWEWLNWKFPRPVHAGDTIYARWTLTQKRPPVGGEPTSIVVWRVDVHTADGALCAEGEVGAKVRRQAAARARERAVEPVAASAAPTVAAAPRRRRRRRPAGSNGPVPETPAAVAPPAPAANQERASGAPRRRRRRRPASSTSAAAREGEAANGPSSAPEPPPAPVPVPAGAAERGGLSRVIRRLRRT